MKLSVIIPAHNEEGCIESTVRAVSKQLLADNIDHEILVVDDNSTDNTGLILNEITKTVPH